MKLIEDLGMLYPREDSKQKRRMGTYECSVCKINLKLIVANIKSGQKSCRKCSKTKHNMSKTRLYSIWKKMKSRCENKNTIAYKWYGIKGISVCDEWSKIEQFCDWALLNGYKDNLTIDRIDSNKNYEPSNCRWITQSENSSRASSRDNFGKHSFIKISEDEASEIYEAYSSGKYTYAEIGRHLNVRSTTIGSIIRSCG